MVIARLALPVMMGSFVVQVSAASHSLAAAYPGKEKKITVNMDIWPDPSNPKHAKPLANGKFEVLIRLSLRMGVGNNTVSFTQHQGIIFDLIFNDLHVKPIEVNIPRGKHSSEKLASLTLNHANELEMTCLLRQVYKGLDIKSPNPVKLEFITPIDIIRIELEHDDVVVNTPKPFKVFLYDNAAGKELVPSLPVLCELRVKYLYGEVSEKSFELNRQFPSKSIAFIGKKLGDEIITVEADYGGWRMTGHAYRHIKIEKSLFIFGFLGGLIGSLLYAYLNSEQKQPRSTFKIYERARPKGSFTRFFGRFSVLFSRHFLVPFVRAFVRCIIIIVVLVQLPYGTDISGISTLIHPGMIFFITLVICALGLETIKTVLSFMKSNSGS